MSSRFPARFLALGLIAALCGCQRENRQDWNKPHARADEVSNTPPQTQVKREPVLPADGPQ
jgi:hypothetical protein